MKKKQPAAFILELIDFSGDCVETFHLVAGGIDEAHAEVDTLTDRWGAEFDRFVRTHEVEAEAIGAVNFQSKVFPGFHEGCDLVLVDTGTGRRWLLTSPGKREEID